MWFRFFNFHLSQQLIWSLLVLMLSGMLGAAMVEVTFGGKRIVFSGDIGRDDHPLLPGKSPVDQTDYLVIESTYGDRIHPEKDVQQQLAKIISSTIQRQGIVLIPTFAIGRAQQLLYHIYQLKKAKQIPDVPVYLNSPMAINATKTYIRLASNLKIPLDELKNIFSGVNYVRDVEESKQLNTIKQPCIILSSSGMLTGGRILHLVKSLGPDQRNSIIIVGFQAAGTRGEALVRGKTEIKIHGQYIPINAQIHVLENLSAHADYREIIGWLKKLSRTPKATFIVHGEPTASQAMQKHVEEKLGWNCTVPAYLDEFKLA